MREFNAQLNVVFAESIIAYFEIKTTTSIKTLTIDSLINRIDFHMMQTNTSFLLCLQNMNKLRVYLNNLKDQIVLKNEFTISIVRFHKHLFLIWDLTSINYLTDIELRQLHRRFKHSLINKLVRTLKRADYNDPAHRQMLQQITDFCTFCQKHSRSPDRFKFTLKNENNAYFNHTIVIDVLYIDDNPILQIVDEKTSFQIARWLTNISASHIWDMLRLCWINVYVESSDVIVHDAETNFDNIEFRQNAKTLNIQTKCVFIEVANSIGLIKKYHVSLKRVYLIIITKLKDQDFIKEIRLQMIIKAVNDTIEYNDLVLTLLVFGTYPHIINDDALSLSITEKTKIIKITMNEVVKLHTKRQTNDILHQRNGPQITRIHKTSIDFSILVWRTHQKKWTKSYKLLFVSRKTETCTMKLINDFINFRIIIVKPYLKKSDTPIQDPIQDSIQDPIQDFIQCPIQDLIQDSIQSIQDPVQLKDITLRRNPSRSR